MPGQPPAPISASYRNKQVFISSLTTEGCKPILDSTLWPSRVTITLGIRSWQPYPINWSLFSLEK